MTEKQILSLAIKRIVRQTPTYMKTEYNELDNEIHVKFGWKTIKFYFDKEGFLEGLS